MISRKGTPIILSLLLISILLLSTPALAEDYTDLEGHWAIDTMQRALDCGFVSGFGDGTVRPDGRVTFAQAAEILCRTLDAQELSDISLLGLSGDEWYANSAGKALYLGLISPEDDLSAPIERREAFVMICEAFQLTDTQADISTLKAFSDVSRLDKVEVSAVASLVAVGFVEGYGGRLNPNGSITRAEFVSLLCRILDSGTLSNDSSVADFSGGNLWLDCSTENIRLTRVQADKVIIRSSKVGTVTLSGCEIGQLVLACGGDVTIYPRGFTELRIGSGSGSTSVRGALQGLEITGISRKVMLSNDVNNSVITGSGNEISIIPGVKVQSMTVTGISNTVSVGGALESISVLGEKTILSGNGNIKDVYLRAPGCDITERAKNLTDATDYGLYGTSVQLLNPELLPPGKTLTVTAKLQDAPPGKSCHETWYIDGKPVSEKNVILSGADEFTLNYNYTYILGMKLQSEIEFRLDYTTEYGYLSSVSAKVTQQLENYNEDQLLAMDVIRVTSLVTSDYLGDYTLAWAQNHDYTDSDKMAWVNSKGFTSDTQYLIWVNQAYQRVNVFEGSKGNWKLIREYIVGCGKGSNTPKGVFKTTYKQTGWFTPHYDVRPVVRFKDGGYAFHSRLYVPGSGTLQDPGIGYPISHGCIRMYDDDIIWIYNNVPEGTTVIVH